MTVKIFHTPYIVAENLAGYLVNMINVSAKLQKPFSLALPGGSTPELLFTSLGDNFSKSVPWQYVHLFWGDERCVPPDSTESNYGMAKRSFIDKINIPESNIHRIKGEDEPGKESLRYSGEIAGCLAERGGLPVFDLIILGLGEDGHTASIFPGHTEILYSGRICEVAVHPVTGQKRVTLTGKILNNAHVVAFLVTGKKKAVTVAGIMNNSPSDLNAPASCIVPVYGELIWFLDKEAGSLLEEEQSLK